MPPGRTKCSKKVGLGLSAAALTLSQVHQSPKIELKSTGRGRELLETMVLTDLRHQCQLKPPCLTVLRICVCLGH